MNNCKILQLFVHARSEPCRTRLVRFARRVGTHRRKTSSSGVIDMALFGGASHLKPGASGGSSGGKMSADLPKPKSYSVAQPFSYGSAYQYKGVDYTIVNAESQYATMGLPGVAIIKAFKRIIRSSDTLALKVEG